MMGSKDSGTLGESAREEVDEPPSAAYEPLSPGSTKRRLEGEDGAEDHAVSGPGQLHPAKGSPGQKRARTGDAVVDVPDDPGVDETRPESSEEGEIHEESDELVTGDQTDAEVDGLGEAHKVDLTVEVEDKIGIEEKMPDWTRTVDRMLPSKELLPTSSSKIEQGPGIAETCGRAGVTPSPIPPSSKAPPAGWNKGISSAHVQISLGSKQPVGPTKKAFTSDSLYATYPPDPRTYRHPKDSELVLELPIFVEKLGDKFTTWQDRFVDWVKTLLTHNPKQVGSLTSQAILDAYIFYIESEERLKGKRRKSAIHSASQAVDKKQLSSILESTQANSPALATTAEDEMAGVLGRKGFSEQEEAAMLGKYFPGNGPPPNVCILCFRPGHRSVNCPARRCKFCDSEKHLWQGCPTKQRCTQCRVPGHRMEQCTNRLRLADGELSCVWCGSEDHDDDGCEMLWRTSSVWTGQPKKVNNIIAYCARCGAEGHYYSNCPALPIGVQKSMTFSQENLMRHFDPNAAEMAVESFVPGGDPAAGRYGAPMAPPNGLRRPERRGTNPTANNIRFESDDSDDDVVFMGERVARGKPAGKINVSIGPHPAAFNGQPPLPPGPPPFNLPPRPPPSYNADVGRRPSMQDPAQRVDPRGGAHAQNRNPSSYHNVPPPASLGAPAGQAQSQGRGQSKSNSNEQAGNSRKNRGGGRRGNNRGCGRGGRRG